MKKPFLALFLIAIVFPIKHSFGGTTGSISGTLVDDQGVATGSAVVQALNEQGKVLKEATSDAVGNYILFPLDFGDYTVKVEQTGFAPYLSTVHVSSGSSTLLDIQLRKPSDKELVIEVTAKRHLLQSSSSVSSREITQEDIEKRPEGESVSLPKLVSSMTPGVIEGTFNQLFFRGNHANIQYQIDGVQLPDSPSNTFGDAFSPRNIDHMEIITGGIPAEYGERLAAVVNIVTKSGPETPAGEVEMNYGTYNTIKPFGLFGGSTADGSLHYFISASYNQSDRGLDTPQPSIASGSGASAVYDQTQGGTDVAHDSTNGNSEFARIDWLPNNSDKLSAILFNSYNYYQIPNYPSAYSPNNAFFQGCAAGTSCPTDAFGNSGPPDANGNTTPTFNYTPAAMNDTQAEINSYLELVWKHTFSNTSFLQVAPYYKFSYINVGNDLTNDLSTATLPVGSGGIYFATPSSFQENRHVNNIGLKSDYTNRIDSRNLFKAGFQVQQSQASGSIFVATAEQTPTTPATINTSSDASPTNFYFESLYLQDDFTIAKPLVLNAGIRYDATQTDFGVSSTSQDSLFEPRIGLNYLVTENTKLHAFYGKLFQPAPAENLYDTFNALGATATCPAGQICSNNIFAEKDDYFEFGVAQQVQNHLITVNAYYKNATNMLDDAQLLNTSIAQPYNYATGYAYGLEFSVRGKVNSDWSDFLNYSYEIAKGQGISGGFFSVGPIPSGYLFLDHVQVHTANAGVTYAKNGFWWSTQALFGSGLRTGPANSLSLPSHFTMDTTVGYEFKGKEWWSKFKVSGDVLNIFNNVFPVTVANGFNGSHYAPEREFLIHISKEI